MTGGRVHRGSAQSVCLHVCVHAYLHTYSLGDSCTCTVFHGKHPLWSCSGYSWCYGNRWESLYLLYGSWESVCLSTCSPPEVSSPLWKTLQLSISKPVLLFLCCESKTDFSKAKNSDFGKIAQWVKVPTTKLVTTWLCSLRPVLWKARTDSCKLHFDLDFEDHILKL